MADAPDVPPRNYLNTVLILVSLDAVIHFGSALFSFYGVFVKLVLHGAIGVWIGAIISWLYKIGELKKPNSVILYWTLFCLSFFAGILFSFLLWLASVVIVMKASYEDTSPDHTDHDKGGHEITRESTVPGRLIKRKKSVWPVYALVMVLLGLIAFIYYVLIADTSEFRGLALLFYHLFITLISLVIAGVLRIPAAARVKGIVVNLQVTIYALIVISWLVYFVKPS